MAVDARPRDKNGEISRKHGNTLIHTLRKLTVPVLRRALPTMQNSGMSSKN
jgi:hypothetical protein